MLRIVNCVSLVTYRLQGMEMLIIKVHNDGTGSNESANYDYGVYVNYRRIANGRIKGHNRDDGWEKLIARLLNESKAKPPYK